MAELRITQTDIDNLAGKLDGLDLPTAEKALLTALVTVAAETLGLTGRTRPAVAGFPERRTELAVEATDPLPAFREQFDNAFDPGARDRDRARPAAGITELKIGHAVPLGIGGKIGPDPVQPE